MDDGSRKAEASPRSPLADESPGIRLFAPGTALASRFEIGAVRGVGGSAVVYSAFDRELRQTVALKVLRADRTSPASLTRMKREVAIARQAASPRLVRVFDIDATGESVFLTMEDVPGGSLKERLAEGPLPLEETLRIAGEILEGLAVLHGLGIVHRDVKPGNVLLDAEGAVKLADFGLARRLEIDETRATSMDAVVGTVEYLSPEQALGHDLDGRSDLYSFGVTLFEMLTGGVPFRRDSAISTALAHVRDAAPRLRSVRPETPAWLEAFVARLLAKPREERYASAEEASADLSVRTATRHRASGPRLRRRVLLALGAVVLAGGAALVGPRLLAPAPLARIVTRSEGRGIRALDVKGRLLWERREFDHEANAIPFRAAGGALRVAALESDGATNTVATKGVWIQLLDAATGRTVGRLLAPFETSAIFPGLSSRYNVVSVDAVDADGDADDELLVSLNHAELYPGILLLVDPDAGTAEMLYVSSGHAIVLGFADVDGDGKRELLVGGPANRLGHYMGVAAIRLGNPLEADVGAARRGRPPAVTPDLSTFPLAGRRLAWYTLGPPFQARAREPLAVDPVRRTIRITGFTAAPFELGFDGSMVGAATRLAPPERLAARSEAWNLLGRASRSAESGDPAGGASLAAEAVAKLLPSGDPYVVEWARRTEARYRIAAGETEEGERLYEDVARASAASVSVALDAGRALHLSGRPDRALRWYERTAFSRESLTERWIVLEGLLDAVLALGELGRLGEVAALAARADVDDSIRESARRLVLWRSGRRLAAPATEGARIGIFRYWALEENLAAGVPPGEVLVAARRETDANGAVAPLLRLVEAEALARLGRASEALPVAREAFEALWPLRLSDVEARGHLAFATERFARVLGAAGQPAEALRVTARTRAFLASPVSGRTPSPLPVRAD